MFIIATKGYRQAITYSLKLKIELIGLNLPGRGTIAFINSLAYVVKPFRYFN